MRNAETVLGIIRIAEGHWRAGCSERRTPGSGRGGWKSAHVATRQPPTPRAPHHQVLDPFRRKEGFGRHDPWANGLPGGESQRGP